MSGFLKLTRKGPNYLVEHHVEDEIYTLFGTRRVSEALPWAFAHAKIYGIPFPGAEVVPLFGGEQ